MAINLGKDGSVISSGDTIGHINSWELSLAQDALETTAFGDGWDRTYVPGLRSGTVTFSGYFEDTDTGQRNIFYQGMSTRTPAVVALKLRYGVANGYEGNIVVTGVTIGSPMEGLQTFSASGQFTSGVSTL